MMAKYDYLKKADIVCKWLNSFQNEKTHRIYVHHLGLYLEWRKITIEELITKGLEEAEKINEFFDYLKTVGKNTRPATAIRNFMRFIGVAIPRPNLDSQKKIIYFEDDRKMKAVLARAKTDSTKKIINRALADYCNWRDMSPTEICNESSLDSEDVKDLLFEFYEIRQNPTNEQKKKFRWKKLNKLNSFNKVFYIARFYRRHHKDKLKVFFEKDETPEKKRGVNGNKSRKKISKDEIKLLMDVADIHDKMILFALYESGLAGVDLAKITYGQIKEALNLENPEDVPKSIIFLNTRQKTNVSHYAMLGKQALKYISLWLKQLTEDVFRNNARYELNDESPVFVCKYPEYKKLSSISISKITKKLSKFACLDRILTAGDFRDTFYTNLQESKISADVLEMFMGHLGGISKNHYNVSDELHFQEQYDSFYNQCFNIEYQDKKYESLEVESRELKNELRDMKEKIRKISRLLTVEFLDVYPSTDESYTKEEELLIQRIDKEGHLQSLEKYEKFKAELRKELIDELKSI